MASINILRALWVQGLNAVTGNVSTGMGTWLKERQYSFSQAVHSDAFVLDVPAFQPLLNALASDINRMSSAAFETMLGIQAHPVSDKAKGWLVIQTYYASFFAAQALLRICGTSPTQIESISIVSSLLPRNTAKSAVVRK